MKKIARYLKGYGKECVLAPLFKMLEAGFELFVPLVVAMMIDRGIGQSDRAFVLRMALVLAALGVVGLASSLTAQFFSAKAAVGCVTKLRETMFRHIQSLSFPDLDRLGIATLITRMTSDMNQVQTGVNLTLRLFMRSPVVVFGAMIMAFTVDGQAARIFVVTIPLLLLVVFGIMLASIPLYGRVQAHLDEVLHITRENLAGVRVLRAFRREADEMARFTKEHEALNRAQRFVGRISALMNPATYVIVNLALVAVLQTGAVRVDGGYLTQGAVVALVNYMSHLLVELIKLANLIITITKASASFRRIERVIDIAPSIADGGDDSENDVSAQTPASVEFRDVSMRYPGAGADALTHITFTARAGETVGVIGGTGSGKSTLASLIPRFYEATGGSVLVNGRDVAAYSLARLRRTIGIVPQKARLFSGTIRENMRWGRTDAPDDAIWAAIDAAQARDVVESKEGALDAPIEQGGKNLSGGQRQRLTIARALVRDPEILILDDSMSALDYATEARLRKSLRERSARGIVFLISQRVSAVRNADKILVLDEGRLAGCGTHEALLAKCAPYREIYASQTDGEAIG